MNYNEGCGQIRFGPCVVLGRIRFKSCAVIGHVTGTFSVTDGIAVWPVGGPMAILSGPSAALMYVVLLLILVVRRIRCMIKLGCKGRGGRNSTAS